MELFCIVNEFIDVFIFSPHVPFKRVLEGLEFDPVSVSDDINDCPLRVVDPYFIPVHRFTFGKPETVQLFFDGIDFDPVSRQP